MIDRARDCTLRVRFWNRVRVANPAACNFCTERAIRATPLASRPESVGYATLASTTVVSARNRFVFNTFASTAFARSASLRSLIAASPQRVVIFINVVGCGTRPPNGIRQNRCHVIESVTSRHNDSNPNRYRYFKNINRRYTSIGIDGRPNVAWKNGANGAKNRSSSSSRSTRSNSAGIPSASGGSNASHNVA